MDSDQLEAMRTLIIAQLDITLEEIREAMNLSIKNHIPLSKIIEMRP